MDQAGQANNQPGIIFLKKLVMLLAAAAVALIINFLPLQIFNNDGLDTLLTLEGKAALAILSFVIILWITEVVPFVIAALTGILLVPLFGLVPFKETVSYGFGNTVVVFFIGILIISVGLTRSGLADRLTGMILAKVGLNSRKLVFIFLLIGAVLSMWIVNMSVSAILLPIALNILHKCKALPLKSNFGRALMISVAWGPAIGGISTPVGNGANIVALGYLRELAGIDINFLSWMTVGVPAAILILPLSYLILIKIFPPEPLADGLEESTVLTGNRGEKIEMTAVEKKALVIFLLAVIFWVGDPLLIRLTGVSIPIEIVALSAAVLFFLPGIEIISWKEAQKKIDWGAIVLIAAGLSLGAVVYETGAAAWLASTAFSPLGEFAPAVRIFLAVLAVELLKVFFSSNTVTGVIMVPLVIALSVKMSIDPWMLAGPVAIATSLAFLLVTSSPTNVIPYSSGYFSILDFLKAGLPLTLLVPFAVTVSFLIFGAFLR